MQIADASQVGAARRAADELARSLGFDETTAGHVSLIVIEAGTNLVKHGGGGQILLRGVDEVDRRHVEIVALDRGPGMANVARWQDDGPGLGVLRRLSCELDIYSRVGHGTAVLARVGERTCEPGAHGHRGIEVGGFCIAMPGEDTCGDAWEEESRIGGTTLLVADGLGHGPAAAEAAEESVKAFRALRGRSPAERVDAIHAALRSTRGAAVAVADVDLETRVVRFAGLGNISARLVGEGRVRHLVSHNGTAGHAARQIDEFTYPWAARDLLIMHSDGLASQRDLDGYPGLADRHPSLVAAVLYRDFTRGRDDVAVVVARERGS